MDTLCTYRFTAFSTSFSATCTVGTGGWSSTAFLPSFDRVLRRCGNATRNTERDVGAPDFFFCLPFADQRSVHQGPPSTAAEVHGEEGPSPLIFRQYWWRWGPYEAIRQYGLDNTAGVERGRAAADYTPAAARAKAAAERYTMGLENFAHRPHLGLVMLF